MPTDATPAEIATILLRIEPHTPPAVTVLRTLRATGQAPDPDTLRDVTHDLVRYSAEAERLATRLKRLKAVSVEDRLAVEAFSL